MQPGQAALKQYDYQSPSEILAGSDDKLSFGAKLKKEVFFYSRDKKAWELITTYYNKWDKYNNIERNDICPCGSNIKFKRCCMEAINIATKVMTPFVAKRSYPFAQVDINSDAISATSVIETPIDYYIG
jgi:hypothetical protein